MNCKIKINLYSFLTVFLWATAFPVTKIIGDDLSANGLGLIRCSTASIFLIIISRFHHIRQPFEKSHLIYFALAGTMGFALYMIFFNTGISTLTSATSSVIIAATPILTAIGACFLYKERINILGWISILAAFCGVIILMFWDGILSVNAGIIWTLAAAVVFCGYNLMNRKLSSIGYRSLEIVTYSMISGSLVLLALTFQTVPQIIRADLSALILAIYLGIMPSATAYILWAKAMELAKNTSEVTNYMFVTPVLSAIMGFMLIGESPDFGTYLGGLIIIASVILFNTKGKA